MSADPFELPPMTRREAQVLELVAQGMSNQEVGKALSISTRTVDVHLQNMYGKTGLSNRTALVGHWREAATPAEPEQSTDYPVDIELIRDVVGLWLAQMSREERATASFRVFRALTGGPP